MLAALGSLQKLQQLILDFRSCTQLSDVSALASLGSLPRIEHMGFVPNWVEGFLDCFGFSFYVVTAEKVKFHNEYRIKNQQSKIMTYIISRFSI